MASRGERTREHILDVAEQLLGEQGVANVSLEQIRLAAGQRNERAVQYHFTDRLGLLRALSERHLPAIQESQQRIVAGNGPRPSMRKLVEAWARPMAEYVTRGPQGRAWVKIVADLTSDPQLSLTSITEQAPEGSLDAGAAVYERLARRLPPGLAIDRMWSVFQFVIHISADRARLLDSPAAAREVLPDDEFLDNLMAMAHAALVAKVPDR